MRDFSWLQRSIRNLVKHRLEKVILPPINLGYVHQVWLQVLGGSKPAKTTADYYHLLMVAHGLSSPEKSISAQMDSSCGTPRLNAFGFVRC